MPTDVYRFGKRRRVAHNDVGRLWSLLRWAHPGRHLTVSITLGYIHHRTVLSSASIIAVTVPPTADGRAIMPMFCNWRELCDTAKGRP